MLLHRIRFAGHFLVSGLLVLVATSPVAAHVVEHAGPYTIEIGWQHEPTYLGESNGVQVIIHDADDKPINDLKTDELKVVVSTGGQQSSELAFEPGFDPVELEGPLGEYDAAIVPTAPGDYTFHVTGSIHGQAVDVTVTSGDETFDAVKGTTDIEFPIKLPALPDVVNRLDRIDARVASGQASVDAAAAQASDARQVADRALLVGGGIGLVGLVLGALGVLLAVRAMRRART
jgi:hypothetical protein